MHGFLSRSLRLFGRALRLRCPNCGQGGLFTSWLRMRERCPACGLKLERGEEGYPVGSYMFNIVAAELIFAAPFAIFPFSKTLFLAFDLLFRPATHDEVVDPSGDTARAR